jgi:hypothetical protein
MYNLLAEIKEEKAISRVEGSWACSITGKPNLPLKIGQNASSLCRIHSLSNARCFKSIGPIFSEVGKQ